MDRQPIILNVRETPFMKECMKRDAKKFDEICNNFMEHRNVSRS